MIHDVYTNIRQYSGATRPSREVDTRLPGLQNAGSLSLGLGQVPVGQDELATHPARNLAQGGGLRGQIDQDRGHGLVEGAPVGEDCG